jgi:hypothetical protein
MIQKSSLRPPNPYSAVQKSKSSMALKRQRCRLASTIYSTTSKVQSLALMMLNSHSRPISMTELWFALFPLVVVESRIGQGNNGWRQLYLLAMVQAGLYKFRSTRSMLHSKMSTLRKRASLQAFTAMDNAPAIQGSNTKQNGIHL